MRKILLALAPATGLALAPGLTAAEADTPAAADPLVGLWASELRYGPALHGELILRRRGSEWEAGIGAIRHRFRAEDGALRFTLPDRAGGFRGHLSGGGRTISGFWIQPSGESEDRRDPGGAGQSFATPISLSQAGPNQWRGEVEPLADRFTAYISIASEADGLAGALRNPQYNLTGGVSRYQVIRTGNSIRFVFRHESGDVSHEATLLRDPDRIRIAWPDLGQTLELSRRDPALAASFFPRPPGAPAYVYRRPDALDDGWETAAGSDAGIDETALTRLVEGLAGADPAARGPSLIHSVLIARHGKLVLEEYFFGHDRETPTTSARPARPSPRCCLESRCGRSRRYRRTAGSMS